MNENSITAIAVLTMITIFVLMFNGEPDLMDAIIHFLMKD